MRPRRGPIMQCRRALEPPQISEENVGADCAMMSKLMDLRARPELAQRLNIILRSIKAVSSSGSLSGCQDNATHGFDYISCITSRHLFLSLGRGFGAGVLLDPKSAATLEHFCCSLKSATFELKRCRKLGIRQTSCRSLTTRLIRMFLPPASRPHGFTFTERDRSSVRSQYQLGLDVDSTLPL